MASQCLARTCVANIKFFSCQLETEYRQFLDAAHRSDKEKRLASQFITRFVEYFPNTYEDAINAMLDLCEEEDPVVRLLYYPI